MTTIQIRYPEQSIYSSVRSWIGWGLFHLINLFVCVFVAYYALTWASRFAVQEPRYVWSEKFSVGHSMTDLRVYEPLRSDSNGFGLQKTLSDELTQNAYCRGCYGR